MKSKRSAFFDNVFHLYDVCLKQMGDSKLKVILLFGICYIELTLYSINTSINSGFISNSSMFMLFAEYLCYAQLITIKVYNSTAYLAISLVLKVFVILNFVFFLLLVTPKIKLQSYQKLNIIYSNLSLYRNFILFFPISEVILKGMFSLDPLMQDSPSFLALNSVTLILLFLLGIIDSLFYQIEFFQKDNIFNTTNPQFYLQFNIYRLFLSICFNLDFKNMPFWVYLTFAIGIAVFQITVFYYCATLCVFEKSFPNIFFMTINGLFMVLLTSLALINVDLNYNFISIFVFGAVLSGILVYHLVEFKDQLYKQSRINNMSNIVQEANYLLDLGKRSEPNSSEAIILRGLIRRHRMKCCDTDCFCGSKELYEAPKNTFTPNNSGKSINLVTKYFIIMKLKKQIQKNPHNHFLKYLLAEFYARKMKNYTLAYHYSSSLRLKKVGIGLEFRLFRLQQYIHGEEEELNRERMKEKNLEELLRFEEAYNHVLLKISELYSSLIEFWHFILENQEIEKKIFKEIMSKILDLKNEIKSILKVLQNYIGFNKQLNFLFSFIQRELLNSKNMVNLEDIFLTLKEDERLSFASTASILNNNFYSIFFNQMSCVVILDIEERNMGIVKKISEDVEKIFGYTRREILGKNIKTLMTPEIARNHDRILHRVSTQGVFLSKTNSTYTYAIDKFRKPIKIKLIYKLNISLDFEIEVCAVLVPITVSSDENLLMIVNEFGFITSISPTLGKMFDLVSENIEKNNYNIGMLNQSMIEFLPIRPLFTKQTYIEKNEGSVTKIFDKNIFHQIEFKVISRKSPNFDKLFLTFQIFKEMNINQIKEALENKNKFVYREEKNEFDLEEIGSDDEVKDEEKVSEEQEDEENVNTSFENLEENVRNQKSDFGNHVMDLITDSSNIITTFVVDLEFIHYKREYDIELFIFKFLKISCKDLNMRVFKERSEKSMGSNLIDNKSDQYDIDTFADQKNDEDGVLEEEVRSDGELEDEHIDGKFLTYLKQPLNLFSKDPRETPTKEYRKINITSKMMWVFAIGAIIAEILFLIVFKLPSFSQILSITSNFKSFKSFELSIVNNYGNYLTAVINPRADNFVNRNLNDLLASLQDPFIRQLIFNPTLNTQIENMFEPGFDLLMDYAFLTENFNFFINQFSLSNFTSNPPLITDYLFQMKKFKPKMLFFMKSLNDHLMNLMTTFQSNLTLIYKIFFFIIIALYFVLFLTVWILIQIIYRNTNRIYDTFLYISDMKIIEISTYFSLSNNFFASQFNLASSNYKSLAKTKNFEINVGKKRSWKLGKETFAEKLAIVNFLVIISGLTILCFLVGNMFLEMSLLSKVLTIQNIGHQLPIAKGAIASVIMNAKDFFLSSESFSLMNPGYYDMLLKNLNTGIDFTADQSSVTQTLSNNYNSYICSLNYTFFPNDTVNCSTFQSSILNNNVDSFKNIIKFNLYFVFQNNSMSNYNYTVKNIVQLDKTNNLFGNAIDSILKIWHDGFDLLVFNYEVLFIIFTIAWVFILILNLLIWNFCIKNRLQDQYSYARKVFINLIPSDTLNLNKLIRVQLMKAEIMNK